MYPKSVFWWTVSKSACRGHNDKVYNGDEKSEDDENDDDGSIDANSCDWRYQSVLVESSIDKHNDGDDDAIDADHYGSVFWLKVSISACRGQLGGRNGNESGGRAVAAHPTEVSRIHKPAKSLQETYKNTQIQNKDINK